MEWFLIIGGVIALLAWTGRKGRQNAKVSSKAKKEPNFRPTQIDKRNGSDIRYSPHKAPAAARWVPAGEAVKIGACRIDSGMFYLGGILPGEREGQSGNCVSGLLAAERILRSVSDTFSFSSTGSNGVFSWTTPKQRHYF